MKRNAAYLTIAILISKILGLVRGLVLSYFYGTSMVSDVYFTSWIIPNVIFGFVAIGLVSTFIPVYIRASEEQGESVADRYMSDALNLITVLAVVLVLLGLVFTKELVLVFAHGYTGAKLELAVRFTKVTLLSIFFIGARSIYESYHEIHNRFLIAPIGSFMMNIVVILSIFMSVKTDIMVLPIGIFIASVIQYLFAYLTSKGKGFKRRLSFDVRNPYVKMMTVMAIPIILGASIDQINLVIDRTIASTFVDGSISAISYASQINDAVLGVFVSTMATVLYPTLVGNAVRNETEQLKGTVTKILNVVNLLMIPASIGIMVLSKPIVMMLLGHGQFDDQAIVVTGTILFFYALGLVAFGMRQVLTKTFYALEDTKTPVRIGVVSVVANILLNLVLSKIMGVTGLALATTLAAFIGSLLLYNALRIRLDGLRTGQFIRSFSKTAFASLIMGFAVYAIYYPTILSDIGKKGVVIAIGFGIAVYMLVMHFMGVPEYDEIIKKRIKANA